MTIVCTKCGLSNPCTCSRCKGAICCQRTPCLSHTPIPFNGTMRVQPNDSMLRKHVNRIRRTVDGRHVRAMGPDGEPTYYEVGLKGLTFDEIAQFENGLSYLDWLAGRDWLYGDFEKRLYAYLRNPCIKRELEKEFPDPEDDSYEPLFMAQDLPPGLCYSWPNGKQDKWHGVHAQKPEPDTWQSEVMSNRKAWSLAADFLHRFETATDPNDYLDLFDDLAELREVCSKITQEAAAKLRAAYRSYRERMKESYADPVGNAYRFHFGVLVKTNGKLVKRFAKNGKPAKLPKRISQAFADEFVRPITPGKTDNEHSALRHYGPDRDIPVIRKARMCNSDRNQFPSNDATYQPSLMGVRHRYLATRPQV